MHAHQVPHTTSLLLQIYDEMNRTLTSQMATFITAPDGSGASEDSLHILAAADVGTLQVGMDGVGRCGQGGHGPAGVRSALPCQPERGLTVCIMCLLIAAGQQWLAVPT